LDLLSEGVKLRCLGAPTGGWVKIELPQGRVGYAPVEALETI
jgi:hypothetical protein